MLSIIIPCFNEMDTIKELLEAVNASPITNKQVIVIDDGSTDGSSAYIENELNSLYQIFLRHDTNRGKGACLRTGISHATEKVVLIQDADLEYDPSQYEMLIEPIIQGHADVVYGSRFIGHAPHRVLYFWHRLGNGFLTLLSNMFTNLNLTDMETCYKVFKREVIQNMTIEENRFGVEPEITAKISRSNLRIYEVGISYYGRTYAEGKKINWRDGISAIFCILKYNLRKY
jgi:glycosyltransferase involved in cell wall biosynthesis